jgi:tetratricopeptide (TPR) repeat protein
MDVAHWLTPDAWIEASGAHELRQPYRPRGGEEDLARMLASDPRRVAAIIAPPGAGASRLCLELARGAPRARYPDPRVEHDPEHTASELTRVFAGVPDTARPVVVLDGPSPDAVLTTLGVLASRRIHPRLLVLVPADPEGAGRLPILSGLSRASLIAVMLEGVAEPLAPAPDALLPFVLSDRAPAGVFAQEALLRGQGLLIDAEGGVLARVGARARRALVERLILGAPDGAMQLAQILHAAPALRAGALASILRWTDGAPEDDVLAVLLDGDGPTLLDVDSLARRAIPVSSRVLSRLAVRAGELLASASGDERAATLLEILARDAALHGKPAIDLLRSALDRTRAPERRARLLAAIAWITGEEPAWRDALAAACAAGGSAHVEVLARRAHALELDERPVDAMECVELWLQAEETRGSAAGAAAARMRLAALARAAGAVEAALEHARRAREDFRSIGDARGELNAVHLGATLLLDAAAFEEGAGLAREALSLADAIGDAASIGWAQYVLGASADRAADPVTALVHYEVAIEAWTESGHPVPERLQEALAAARASAVAPMAPVLEEGASGEPVPEPLATPSPKPRA